MIVCYLLSFLINNILEIGEFSAITSVRFSPVRPLLFAAASGKGLIYLFRLNEESRSAPIAILDTYDAPAHDASTSTEKKSSVLGRRVSSSSQRAGITGLSFNHKQRDLVAACDMLGRIHIWKLSWDMASKQADEENVLNAFGDLSKSSN